MKRGMVFTVAIISSVVLQVAGSAADDVIALTKAPGIWRNNVGSLYPPSARARSKEPLCQSRLKRCSMRSTRAFVRFLTALRILRRIW